MWCTLSTSLKQDLWRAVGSLSYVRRSAHINRHCCYTPRSSGSPEAKFWEMKTLSNHEYAQVFAGGERCAHDGCFPTSEWVNLRMQGRIENILTSTDKLRRFRSKLVESERAHVAKGTREMCPLEPPIEMREHHGINRRLFNDSPLDRFWSSPAKEYPVIAHRAATVMLPFHFLLAQDQLLKPSTHQKQREREREREREGEREREWEKERERDVDEELRVCLLSVPDRIRALCATKQAQVSH